MTAPAFAQAVLGWKAAPRRDGEITNRLGWSFIPNVADNGNVESLTLAAAILTALGKPGPAGRENARRARGTGKRPRAGNH